MVLQINYGKEKNESSLCRITITTFEVYNRKCCFLLYCFMQCNFSLLVFIGCHNIPEFPIFCCRDGISQVKYMGQNRLEYHGIRRNRSEKE